MAGKHSDNPRRWRENSGTQPTDVTAFAQPDPTPSLESRARGHARRVLLTCGWPGCWVCPCQVVLNRWPSTCRRQDTRGNGAWKRSMRLGPKDTWSGRSLPASRRERRKVRAALVLFQLVAGHCWGRISVHSMYKPGSETQRTDLHCVRRTLCRGGNSQRRHLSADGHRTGESLLSAVSCLVSGASVFCP